MYVDVQGVVVTEGGLEEARTVASSGDESCGGGLEDALFWSNADKMLFE